MSENKVFEIFLVAIPGLEAPLRLEAIERGFKVTGEVPGGIVLSGTWHEVWRANLELRGCSRVLARIATFHAVHVAQLDKRARAVPWKKFLRKDVPVRVEASCKRSKIYHSGALSQRIATAITEERGLPIADEAAVTVMARIEDNLVTISLDTSGELLHRRGSKQAIAKAPLRETMAAMFLSQCGFTGTEPVYDPMCGSGTFVVEAAEMALGLAPGRNREFAFESLAGFDPAEWSKIKSAAATGRPAPTFRFHGSDRDQGAIAASKANASRAGVSSVTFFAQKPVSTITPPDGPPGLVIMNPPYGTRIGDKRKLFDLYASAGAVLRDRFKGWRVGLITTDTALAHKTGLTFMGGDKSVLHGGLRVQLYQTQPLT
jgi:putative N6-adenine-specific DNA methylase